MEEERRPVIPVAPPAEAPLRDPRSARPPQMYADFREPLEAIDAIRSRGIRVEVRALQPADFVLGAVAVERKTVGDFASSIFDGRLFEQVRRILGAYDRALLVLEGNPAELSSTGSPGAVLGALASVAYDWEVPVIPTADPKQTGLFLAALYLRMTKEGPASISLRHKPPRLSESQESQFVVQGLPLVGDVMSARLLDRFGSARRVLAASEGELRRVPGLGPERARRITAVLDRPWGPKDRKLGEDGAEP
jgi:Fanconi anemia group M protein